MDRLGLTDDQALRALVGPDRPPSAPLNPTLGLHGRRDEIRQRLEVDRVAAGLGRFAAQFYGGKGQDQIGNRIGPHSERPLGAALPRDHENLVGQRVLKIQRTQDEPKRRFELDAVRLDCDGRLRCDPCFVQARRVEHDVHVAGGGNVPHHLLERLLPALQRDPPVELLP